MAVTLTTGGILVSTSSAQTLCTTTVSGVYVLSIDTKNLSDGDELVITISTIVGSTETAQLAYSGVYANAQALPIKYSIPVPSLYSFSATLATPLGVSTNFAWSLLSIG